jgi:transposase-like protein
MILIHASIRHLESGIADMIRFTQFLDEEKKPALHVFDIDDTMFHTTAKVRVRNSSGKIVKYLSNSQFNDYKLKPGEKYDFKEFKSAKKFHDESHPIHKMISKVKRIHGTVKKNPHSKVIINTARSDFDDKDKFLKTFKNQGIDIDDIHVHRAGNIQKSNESPAVAKTRIIKDYIQKHGYKKVMMYDDSKTNLRALLAMKKEHPGVKFVAYHAQPDGSIKIFKDGD